MKCENCGKNEVSFLYKSNINGKVEEKHLCTECAKKLGYMSRTNKVFNSMAGFGNRFGSGFGLPGFIRDDGIIDQEGNAVEDVRNSYYGDPFGFSRAFGSFFDMSPTFRSIMNSFNDVFNDLPALGESSEKEDMANMDEAEAGDKVNKSGLKDKFSKMRQENQLRAELKKAIKEENFERAAEIRDELKEMEKQVNTDTSGDTGKDKDTKKEK